MQAMLVNGCARRLLAEKRRKYTMLQVGITPAG